MKKWLRRKKNSIQKQYAWLKLLWQVISLEQSALWAAAQHAVHAVEVQRDLHAAAQIEEQPSYCPLCGQIPDGDRRMDHARRIAMEILPVQPRRSDLDFAISFFYWRSKL